MPANLSKRYRGLLSSYTLTTAAGALTVPVRNSPGGRVLITLTTANESGTMTLQMAVNGYSGTGSSVAFVASLTAAVTANGTTHYLFGASSATEEGPITEAFLNPLPSNFDIVLTPTVGTSFDVTLGVAFC